MEFYDIEQAKKEEMSRAVDRAHLHNLSSIVEKQATLIEELKAERDAWRQQYDAFAQFTDFRCIPSQAVEAAIDELLGYDEPSESRVADAIAAAVRALLTKVALSQALASALENASPTPNPRTER